MNDTYRGDSPGKKIARVFYWQHVESLMRGAFTKQLHVVLASREGGDIGCLLGLGVPAANIVAVDRCREAAEACQAAFPDVRVVVGDVVDVVRTEAARIGSVYLDFCGNISDEDNNRAICAVTGILCSLEVAWLQVVGVCVLRGREQGSAVGYVGMSRGCKRTNVALARRAARHGVRGAKEALALLGERPVMDGIKAAQEGVCRDREISLSLKQEYAAKGSAGQARARMVAEAARALGGTKSTPYLFCSLDYNSTSANGPGSPMTIALMLLRKKPKQRFGYRGNPRRALEKHTWNTDMQPAHFSYDKMQDDALRVMASSARITHDALGRRSQEVVAQIFGLEESTIAAWKAHRSRGTYTELEKEFARAMDASCVFPGLAYGADGVWKPLMQSAPGKVLKP